MPRLVIITTIAWPYELLKKAKSAPGAAIRESGNVLFPVGGDKIFVIDEGKPGRLQPISDIAAMIKLAVGEQNAAEPYCAFHSEERMRQLRENIGCSRNVWHFSHDPADRIYTTINALLDAPNLQNIDHLCELIEAKSASAKILDLRQQLGRLLFPLDVDLQGIASVYFDQNDAVKAQKHLSLMIGGCLDINGVIAETRRCFTGHHTTANGLLEISRHDLGGGCVFDLKAFVDKLAAAGTAQSGIDSLMPLYVKRTDGKTTNLFHLWFKALSNSIT